MGSVILLSPIRDCLVSNGTAFNFTFYSCHGCTVQRGRVTVAARLVVVKAVLLNIHVFWDVTPAMSVPDFLYMA